MPTQRRPTHPWLQGGGADVDRARDDIMDQRHTLPPDITLVTVCKGRLDHLKQTLPTFVTQAGVRCVVVDYACPQGTGDWVESHFPEVRVVRHQEDDWCLARGRNLGARAAGTEWLMFVDADIRLAPDFVTAIRPRLTPGIHYRATPLQASCHGTVICHRRDFEAVGGYDEAFLGWGGEDDDLYYRFAVRGVGAEGFPVAMLSPIEHGDEERTGFTEVGDMEANHRINRFYRLIKDDVTRVLGSEPPLEQRRRLYRRLESAILAGRTRFALPLGPHRYPGMGKTRRFQIERDLVYSLKERG